MTAIEQNILDLLPNLSEEAKDKARVILGKPLEKKQGYCLDTAKATLLRMYFN